MEVPQQTAHSLEYLAYLTKRKRKLGIKDKEKIRRFTGLRDDDPGGDETPAELTWSRNGGLNVEVRSKSTKTYNM